MDNSSPWLALVLLAGLAVTLAGGCAKTGDPQPPILRIPKPAGDLQVRQYSGQALLMVSQPTANTTGTPVSTLARVEVLRVVETERARTAPLSENDFVSRAEAIAAISAADLPSYTRNGKLVFTDPLGVSDPAELYRSAYRYAVRFVNNRNQAAGISNQVLLAPLPLPAAPDNVVSDLSQDRIRLTWAAPAQNVDGSRPPTIVGFNVYRGESPTALAPAPLNPQPVQKAEFEDRTFEFGKTYYYAVSVVGRTEGPYAESAPSRPIAVEARDTFPPGAPENLNAIVEPGAVILLWSAPPQNDVAGYRVYRAVQGQAERHLLEPDLVKEPSYRDTNVQAGGKYVYGVHAVDVRGNEGPGAETAVEVP
jgi:hypothetical protein